MEDKKVDESKLKGVNRTLCKIYSRVVGYFSPISEWNKGKKKEFGIRETFKVN